MLSACGGAAPADTSDGSEEPRDPVRAFEWRAGDEHSFIAHNHDREVIRCWSVQGRYDCLVAQSIGLKDVIPGAPARIVFFRFRADDLPATQDNLDSLATSDGYACELTSLPEKTVMTESYWRSGKIIHQRASDRDGHDRWTSADIAGFDGTGITKQIRPFFMCSAVVDPVMDVGLYALDSSLIDYDRIFSAVDYPGGDRPHPTES